MTNEELYEKILKLIIEDKKTLQEICDELQISFAKATSAVGVLKTKGVLNKNYIIKKDYNIGIEEIENEKNINEIEIVKVNFCNVEKVSFENLFEGYDELYAITYSSSPDFIYNLSKKFKYMEIIFGCSKVLNGTAEKLFASQMCSVELLNQSKYQKELIERITNKTLSVWLPINQISHEKIYILRNDNKTRVIVGSSNMSTRAFTGIQRENILYMDELDAYRYYKGIFEELKLNSTNELCIDSIELKDDIKIENTPIFGIVKEKEYVYIKNENNSDEYELTTSIEELSSDVKQYLSEPIKRKGFDNAKLTFDNLQKSTIKRTALADEEKERRKEYPKFKINRLTGDIYLNNVNFKEHVNSIYTENTIKKDILTINEFINGFNNFIGDNEHSKTCFWKLLTYLFASPFLTECRKYNDKYGYAMTSFPMYCIIYGDSNAAKTTMVNFIQKAMFGMNFPDQETESFTPTRIFGLKTEIEGVPITINDLSGEYWSRNAGKILKNDSWELKKKNNSPATVITTNEVSSIKPELSRRCILLNVSAKIGREESMKNAKIISDILNRISPKFYLSYLEHFIPKLNKMIENMEYNKDPDIFEISSIALIEVIKENFNDKRPYYAKILTNKDYFGEEIVGYTALNKIKEEYAANKEAFNIIKKRNVIEINFEKNYLAQRLANELPINMEARVVGTKLILNLTETEKFTKINFSKKNNFKDFRKTITYPFKR